MTKKLLISITFAFFFSFIGQALSVGIFETRYIEEDFKVFHEGYSPSSRFHTPEISLEHLLDDYILSLMNKYIDSADDYVRKKNGEATKRPRSIMSSGSFGRRVKAAPYLVMKHEIEKNGSSWPGNWTFSPSEANAAEQEEYVSDVAHKISQYILAARTCFDIDPTIMTALIHKESFFSPVAVSHTGAAGLTQFTGVAFAEIAMQTGAIPDEADKDAIRYNHEGLDCMKRETGEDIPAIDEIYTGTLYYTAQSNGRRSIRSSAIPTLKNYFKDHMLSSIAYASILLKTYLALECRLAPGLKCYKDKKSGKMIWEREYLYKRALQRYNGDVNINPKTGLMVRQHYAADIWKEAVSKLQPKLVSQVGIAHAQANTERREEVESEEKRVALVEAKKDSIKQKNIAKSGAKKEEKEETGLIEALWKYFTKKN